MYECFIPFYVSVLFPYMDIFNISFVHLSVDGYLGSFHFLTILCNAAMSIYVQVFVWPHFLLLLGMYLSVYVSISSVHLPSHAQLFATPWTIAHQASLSITNSWSWCKLMSTELVMPSNHLILCHPLCLLPSIFPNIRDFSNESVLRIR